MLLFSRKHKKHYHFHDYLLLSMKLMNMVNRSTFIEYSRGKTIISHFPLRFYDLGGAVAS